MKFKDELLADHKTKTEIYNKLQLVKQRRKRKKTKSNYHPQEDRQLTNLDKRHLTAENIFCIT